MTQPATDVEITETLDCRGLLCPLPVYKAGVVLSRLASGDVLKLITTDPGALEDIPALARQRGDTLIATEQADGTQTFWLQKGGAA
ncbi:MAG TPA: sulfurtransferase TusA family protein [Acidimicrobiia bacterium]|nr:sulfurtransferase TusA family protein [Acidimicrobiia bacterium]